MGHLFVSRSRPNGLAPELLTALVESSTDGKEVSVDLTMDGAAIVTCLAIESDGSSDVLSTPSTVSEVLLTGQTAKSGDIEADGTFSATITIDGLVPSTEYLIYCATVSTAGNVASYDDMVRSQGVIGNVTTNCCRCGSYPSHWRCEQHWSLPATWSRSLSTPFPHQDRCRWKPRLYVSDRDPLDRFVSGNSVLHTTMASPLTTYDLRTSGTINGEYDGLYSLNVTLRGTASHSTECLTRMPVVQMR